MRSPGSQEGRALQGRHLSAHPLPSQGIWGAGSPFPISAVRAAYSFFLQGPEADPNPSGSGNWIPTPVLCLAFGDGAKVSEQPYGDIG